MGVLSLTFCTCCSPPFIRLKYSTMADLGRENDSTTNDYDDGNNKDKNDDKNKTLNAPLISQNPRA